MSDSITDHSRFTPTLLQICFVFRFRSVACVYICFQLIYLPIFQGIRCFRCCSLFFCSFLFLSFFFFFSFFFIILSSPFNSLPPSRNSDPRSHTKLFYPPSTAVRALHFFREKISALSSLIDPPAPRIVLTTHAMRSQQLILFIFHFCK